MKETVVILLVISIPVVAMMTFCVWKIIEWNEKKYWDGFAEGTYNPVRGKYNPPKAKE